MILRRSLLSVVLLSSLAGCALGGAGLGSLVAQGLQGLGGGASGAPTNAGPFRTVDNTETMRQLDDLASRAVSQTCAADTGPSSPSAEAPASAPAAQSHEPSDNSESSDDPDARCGYRNICLPGNMRPVRMLICRNEPASPTVAHAETIQR
jgi:hypothetical protein